MQAHSPLFSNLFLSLPADEARVWPARKLHYQYHEGSAVCLLWMGGFRSDLTSTKAQALMSAAAQEGYSTLAFDYTAHGESEGDFTTATLSLWLDDAIQMIRHVKDKKVILVGSSMGGWLALRATEMLQAENRAPSGLVLIAPAIDFTERLMWQKFPPEIREQIIKTGVWLHKSAYAEAPYPITRALIEDGRNHLLFDQNKHYNLPIHILQGAQDVDVPLAHVRAYFDQLPQEDLRFTIIPDGNHRLSREADIKTLIHISLNLAREIT